MQLNLQCMYCMYICIAIYLSIYLYIYILCIYFDINWLLGYIHAIYILYSINPYYPSFHVINSFPSSYQHIVLFIWRSLEIGVPPNHPFTDVMFMINHLFRGNHIYGKPHLINYMWYVTVSTYIFITSFIINLNKCILQEYLPTSLRCIRSKVAMSQCPRSPSKGRRLESSQRICPTV